jgi:hypothetical protein
MPRGPKGEKRPTDVIGNAVHVMRIATLPGRRAIRRLDVAKVLGALAYQRREPSAHFGGALHGRAYSTFGRSGQRAAHWSE